MGQSLVIIPTYNESSNISKILEATMNATRDFHVLVVDDGSPDGTAGLVRNKMEKYPNRIFLEERQGKLGLGTAYIKGFKWGLANGYQYIFEMDADFSHNPEDLIRLHKVVHSGKSDVAVGSRYVKGGKVVNWPFLRLFLSYGASLYVRIITWMPVKDPTAGFICYHRKVLERLDLDNIKFIGYAFQIEMKYKARIKGFSISEIPITFTDRIEGSSKMSKAIVREAIFGVIKLKWLRITGKL
ncbi:MAG: polyprenol monophosphomannose synthase [Saprospirales bacterium]|nr:MAG: polyprenol monophosphomannose synthase [Saprospirales bacterium]